MDRLDAMGLLLAAIDEKSLARAARILGRSPAAVTRAIALLETHAGERLLHRSSRTLKLTEAGERRVPVYRQVLLDLASAENAPASGTTVRGSLVITAPELFGRLNLMPVVESFLDAYPAVSARVLLMNRMTDLVAEGIDVAIRIAPLRDSGLVAIRLGELHRVVCASPAYLARRGTPTHPGELANHACIGHNEGLDRELWTFKMPEGEGRRLRSFQVSTRLSLNASAAALEATLRGHGIGWFRSYQVAERIADGALVRLMPEFEPAPTPAHLIFHARPRRDGAIRAFIDHATPLLRQRLAEIARIMG